MPNNSIPIKTSDLRLDRQNPRLSEFGITEHSRRNEIIEVLWNQMAAEELMYSIVSSGFWDYDPLIAIKDGKGKYIVLEGNRRLAAVLLILDPSIIGVSIPESISSKITDELRKNLGSLPVVVVPDRENAWRYLGFKHVNGPARWGSFAKAKYLAYVKNNFGIGLSDIAFQIGDTNKTAQRLYRGLMVLEQAKEEQIYNYQEDIYGSRLYFSHLYTGLQRNGIQAYLGVKAIEEESPMPVPPEKTKKELRNILVWLYGYSPDNIAPIIKSQNPDLRNLDNVLQSREATLALEGGASLNNAFELSRPPESIFAESLVAAKQNLHSARAYLTTGFNGDIALLRVAGSVANMADDLYNEMEKKVDKLEPQRKKRLTE